MQARGRPHSQKKGNKSGYNKKQWKPRTTSTTQQTISDDDIKTIQSIVGDGFTPEYIRMVLISVDGRVEIAVDYLLNELEKSSPKDKQPVISPPKSSSIALKPSAPNGNSSGGKPICIVLNDNKEHINTRFVKTEEIFEHIWVNLPVELVQHILSYCDLVDAGILMQVCRSWKQIIEWTGEFWNTMWKMYLEPRYPESSRAKHLFENEYKFVRALVQRKRKCSKCHKQFYDYDNEWLVECRANSLKKAEPHKASGNKVVLLLTTGPYILKMMEVRCRQPSRAFRLLREFMKNEIEVPHSVDASTKWHGSDTDIFFKDPNGGAEISDIMEIFHYLIGLYAFKTSTVASLSKWLDSI